MRECHEDWAPRLACSTHSDVTISKRVPLASYCGFSPSHCSEGETLGLDISGRMARGWRGVPFEDRSTGGTRGGSALTRRHCREVSVSPWLHKKPRLLSKAYGAPPGPPLHRATMWRWWPPGFPTSQQGLKQRGETCSAQRPCGRRRGDSHVGSPTVRDAHCQGRWSILRAGH